jgi:hypothetical protein
MKPLRYEAIDTWRGGHRPMTVYHFCFDLNQTGDSRQLGWTKNFTPTRSDTAANPDRQPVPVLRGLSQAAVQRSSRQPLFKRWLQRPVRCCRQVDPMHPNSFTLVPPTAVMLFVR